VLADIFEANFNEVATKDIKFLKEDIKHLEERLCERFDGKFIQLEQRMTIKLGTLMIIAVSAVATLVKLL
jgi:hypothetical protein